MTHSERMREPTRMSTVVEFTLPTQEFALAETFRAVPSATVEVIRLVAYDSDRAFPYLWVGHEGVQTLDDALANDPTTENVTLVSTLDGTSLYRMDWIDSIELMIRILVEEDGVILNANGTNERWKIRALFPDRDAFSRTYDICEERNLTMNIDRIYRLTDFPHGQYGLTKEQYSVLALATKRGYFSVPRTTSMGDLAEELDISQQAVSERLRRAHDTLVRSALAVGPEISTEPETEH